MIIIKEYLKRNESIYKMYSVENRKMNYIKKLTLFSATHKIDGQSYTIVYDEYMKPINKLFEFLNFEKINAGSENTKDKSLRALKLLYVYQQIISKNLSDFNQNDFQNLKTFLKGFSPKGIYLKFDLVTQRSHETVNGYLSIYRKFAIFHCMDIKYLTKISRKYSKLTYPETEVEFHLHGYRISESVPKKYLEVPRYISVEEFIKIIKQIRNKYTIQEEIIIRLMFQLGLRIGEVLGLTSDDLKTIKVDGNYYPMIFLRNRVSDNKKYQSAKSCMKVADSSQYKTQDYKTANYGYQKISCTDDLFELINKYIEDKHSFCFNKHPDNYEKYMTADRVRRPFKFEQSNYYVFINSIGRRLSQTSWNVILRKILLEVDLNIDRDIKKHNLNHRFRHGFAMFNIRYLNANILQLQERLRHKSVQSVYKYYRPTTSDAIKMKMEFANSLQDIFPELITGGKNDNT